MPQGRAKQMAEALDWCPERLRADYRRMRDRQNYTPAEARRMIEDHIAVEERRAMRTA